MASSVTPDIAGLRALSHPVRLRMLGLLRSEGPATATTLAQRLDLNTGATSYHLRQLAQHGFIAEDTERGNARDRWWRAAHDSTRTDFRAQGESDEDVEAYLSDRRAGVRRPPPCRRRRDALPARRVAHRRHPQRLGGLADPRRRPTRW